jgi:hypothetical protein
LRRPVIALLCSLTLLTPLRASAFGDTGLFSFALLRHEGLSPKRAAGYQRIAWEVAKRTSIDVSVEAKSLDATDPELFKRPFLVLTGDDAFAPFGEAQREALRRYLTFGGLLLVDDASGQPGGPFDRAARREVAALFPAAKLAPIAKEHVLWKSFYLLDGPVGRVQATTEAHGLTLAGRLAVVFSPNDLAGAVARDAFGNWEFEVASGGDTQRERALRFGINLAMYALCLDYKDDQVHVPFIMKRRR